VFFLNKYDYYILFIISLFLLFFILLIPIVIRMIFINLKMLINYCLKLSKLLFYYFFINIQNNK